MRCSRCFALRPARKEKMGNRLEKIAKITAACVGIVASGLVISATSYDERAAASGVRVAVTNPMATTAAARGYFISLINERSVDIDITPTPSGTAEVALNEVNVLTNAPLGYKLYVSSDQAADYGEGRPGNALYRGGNTEDALLSPTSGAVVADTDGVMMGATAELDSNAWGFNVVEPEADDASSGIVPAEFAAMPLSSSPQLIKKTSGPETELDKTDSKLYVYYGAKVTPAKPAGTYSGRAVYTAVTDAARTEEASVTPSTTSNFAGGETVRVITSLFGVMDEVGEVSVMIGEDVCVSPVVDTDDDVVSVTCVLPEKPALERSYDVTVSIPKYGKTYVAEGGLTYKYVNLMETISTMQAMTPAICSGTTTPAAFNEDGTINAGVPEAVLYDIRGTAGTYITANPAPIAESKGYIVRKMADGNCWMAENLYLPLTAGVGVEASKNNGSVFTFTPASCSGKNGACAMNGNTITNGTNWYYSSYAALAGLSKYGDKNKDIDGSICPAHWKLPYSYNYQHEKSYGELFSVYNIPISTRTPSDAIMEALDSAPFSFVRAGIARDRTIGWDMERSHWWSSTLHATDGQYTYDLDIAPYLLDATYEYNNYDGLFVRCVAI